jgi:hypothetical protein
VVGCAADYATALDEQGFYAYVVSPSTSTTTPTAPSWLPPAATWVPWGDPSIPNDLLFSEMLPMPNFTLTGGYFPKGVFCLQQLYMVFGWQGCFLAAGLTSD